MSSHHIAIFPGSFDPFTSGHLDIVRRANDLFGDVFVAVGCNPGKTPLFSIDDRVRLIGEICAGIGGVMVRSFEGLVVDCARALGASVIIRGMRADHDFGAEFQFVHANYKLDPGMEIVFLMAHPSDIYLSSSVVREAAMLGRRIIPGSVPPPVEQALRQKFRIVA